MDYANLGRLDRNLYSCMYHERRRHRHRILGLFGSLNQSHDYKYRDGRRDHGVQQAGRAPGTDPLVGPGLHEQRTGYIRDIHLEKGRPLDSNWRRGSHSASAFWERAPRGRGQT